MRQLRRGVERQPQAARTGTEELVEIARADLIRELEELITALDRRLPRVEAAGEAAIARDAVALRARAVARLEQLKGAATGPAVST